MTSPIDIGTDPLAALRWQVEAGADEAIGAEAVDATRPSARPPKAVPAVRPRGASCPARVAAGSRV